MAHMIPANFDEATTSEAERVLYDRLQNHLEDDWTVIHSLPWLDDSRPRLREGECDFLLLHPRYGMLVLEAKSGTPQYDGQTKNWSYEDGTRVTDPFVQARSGMHYLQDELCKKSVAWRDAELPYGYAVAFPDARSVVGNLHPEMGMDLLLLEPDLDRLQAAVIQLLGRFGRVKESLDEDIIDIALDVLQPTFGLIPSVAPGLELARRELVRLTEDQALVMEGMSDNERLVVHGGAGTGKTLLIIGQAKRWAVEGKKVLVLCFNRPLGKYLGEQLADFSEIVSTNTFHNFCLGVLRETGAEIPDSSAKDYWDKGLPDAALAAMPNYPHRYDAILVDEAQDFLSDWWLMIEEFLDDPEESYFHLFCDDYQNLYEREGQLPFTKPKFILRKNCRNTGPIAEFTRGAVGLGEDPALKTLPAGPAPVVHEVTDPRQERDAVRRVLHELVNELGISPDEIVILGCHKLERSSFAEDRKLGNLTVRDAESPAEPNTVRYSTVHKFKGLEADCVLLTGIDEPSGFYQEEHMRRFVYVGGSRARVILHVFKWIQSHPK